MLSTYTKTKTTIQNQIASNTIVVGQVFISNHYVFEQAYQNEKFVLELYIHLKSMHAFISAA